MDITDAQIEAFAFSYWPVSAVTMLEKEREHLRISLAAALSQAEPTAIAGQDGTAGLIKTAISEAMGWSPSEDGPSYAATRAKVERLISEALAALSRAPAGVQVKADADAMADFREGVVSAARQAIIDAAYRNASDKDVSSALYSIETHVTNAINHAFRDRAQIVAPPAAGVQAVPIPGLSAWEGWDRSRGDWSESKHKDDVLEALFRAPWSIEDAAALLGFIDRTWTRRPAPTAAALEEQRNDG